MSNVRSRKWPGSVAVVVVLLLAAGFALKWLNITPPVERPATIERVATISTGFANGGQIAEINDAILCISSPSSRVNFYSVTNPVVPVLFASVEVPGMTKAITHGGQFFYLSGDGWLRTFSSSGNSLVITNSEVLLPSNTLARLKIRNGYLFAAASAPGRVKQGRIFIFSLADSASPKLVSTLASPPQSGFADIEFKDNLLYVADYYGKRIEVYDLRDIQNPNRLHSQTVENRHCGTSFEPWRMLIKDNALYLQDDDSWQVFSLKDPMNPAYHFDLQVARDVEGSQLVGDLLLWSASGVSEGHSGVLVYDCRNAFNPTLLGRTDFGEFNGYCWGAMNNQYIYQPDGPSLHILKVPQLPAGFRRPSLRPNL
jgi:hypothetical protein